VKGKECIVRLTFLKKKDEKMMQPKDKKKRGEEGKNYFKAAGIRRKHDRSFLEGIEAQRMAPRV